MSNLIGGFGSGPKCNMCNRTVIRLVPLYDNDQHHKKQMCCIKCKRAIRKGQEIEKFSRREAENDKNI